MWLDNYINHFASFKDRAVSPQEMAAAIHDALEIAEAEKYATPESRFAFGIIGATDEDVAEIRRHLTPFENSIVEIETK